MDYNLEKMKNLEQLKKNGKNDIQKRLAGILYRDNSEVLISDMRSDWDFCKVDLSEFLHRNQKETKENEIDNKK